MKPEKNKLLLLLESFFKVVNDLILYPLSKPLSKMGLTPEFAMTIAIIALDQYSKFLTQATFQNVGDSIPLVKGVFSLTYVQNFGVAFGLFKHKTYLPVVMAGIMILIVLYYIHTLTEKEYLTRVSLALLMGGAIGNLIDRLTLGYVVDFFDWHYLFKWPVFNFADIFIDVAVGILFLEMLFTDSGEENNGVKVSGDAENRGEELKTTLLRSQKIGF